MEVLKAVPDGAAGQPPSAEAQGSALLVPSQWQLNGLHQHVDRQASRLATAQDRFDHLRGEIGQPQGADEVGPPHPLTAGQGIEASNLAGGQRCCQPVRLPDEPGQRRV
jgi:hypothetical protein